MNDRRITFIKDMDRRSMIRMGVISAASVLINGKALALRRIIPPPVATPESIPQEIIVPKIVKPEERKICIYNLHTKEHQETIYWRNGEYIESALIDLDFIFRDHYNGSVKKIDRRLLDFLFAIQQKVGTGEPFQLISGYRSKRTNARLRINNKGVARKSLHIFGKAADIRLPAVGIKKLRRAAYELQTGGVGYYPQSNFVHIDVGRVRFWRG
jgi:uncharacterized protein YcbK (DUF882 family)